MQIKYSTYAVTLFSVVTLFASTLASGSNNFNLGFEISPNESQILPGNCGIGGTSNFFFCGIGFMFGARDPDRTPFYQGQVRIDGITYWHVIVGDPDSGFAMESYTRKAAGLRSFSGGKPGRFFADLEAMSGNGWDPLGLDPERGVEFTGNGSGDPTKTVFRQVMGDGTWDATNKTWNCDTAEFCAEFRKDKLGFKPVFSQTINSTSGGVLMKMQFELDMSDITYSDMSRAGALTNKLSFVNLDPDLGSITDESQLPPDGFHMPPGDPNDFNIPSSDFDQTAGDFDMATDIEQGRSEVSGGRYIYNPGTNIFIDASYTYNDGTNTDPMAYNWGIFWDPEQNSSLSGNETKCDNRRLLFGCGGGFFGGGSGFGVANNTSNTSSTESSSAASNNSSNFGEFLGGGGFGSASSNTNNAASSSAAGSSTANNSSSNFGLLGGGFGGSFGGGFSSSSL